MTDRRFENRLWWLTIVLLVLALVLTVFSFRPGPAWAEMPADHVLLSVDRGRATVSVDGEVVTFEPGDRRYLAAGAEIDVPTRSAARLTFPGGAVSMLCAGSRLDLGKLATTGGRERSPSGTITLQSGRLLADTHSTSGAYRPLHLSISRSAGEVVSDSAAWYAVDPGAVTVSTGRVSVGGAASDGAGGDLTCGDGVAVTPPTAGGSAPTEQPFPTDSPSGPPSELPSVAPSTSATAEPTATTEPATGDQTTQPTENTTQPTTRPTTRTPTTNPTRTRPPATTPPTTTAPTTQPTTQAPTTAPTETSSVTASAPSAEASQSSSAAEVLSSSMETTTLA